MSTTKVAAARANLDQAGLGGLVRILAGDARDTLAGIPCPIGLVLLDGWKDLCLPVLRLLEPRLPSGALVVADDITLPTMADYLDYVRETASGYVSVAFQWRTLAWFGSAVGHMVSVQDVAGPDQTNATLPTPRPREAARRRPCRRRKHRPGAGSAGQ